MPLTPGVVDAHHCREKSSNLLTQRRKPGVDDGRAANEITANVTESCREAAEGIST
jgi:hypothetical protein